jgi:trans-aconitate 2-methyltransferase
MPVREWDGTSYDRISGVQEALGREVLGRLALRGDEVVLDAGCGSGRITEALLERLPRGHVIGLDESPSMIAAARRRLASAVADGTVELRVGDLLELEADGALDAILSTATFHWIADHQTLFARLRGALRSGGRLVAQCGGKGNIDVLRARAREVLEGGPYARHFAGFEAPWNYASAEDTERRLLAAGFASARCWLQEAPREPEEPREFLATIVLSPYVERLPEQLREAFLDELLERLDGRAVVDYVRLNIEAVA